MGLKTWILVHGSTCIIPEIKWWEDHNLALCCRSSCFFYPQISPPMCSPRGQHCSSVPACTRPRYHRERRKGGKARTNVHVSFKGVLIKCRSPLASLVLLASLLGSESNNSHLTEYLVLKRQLCSLKTQSATLSKGDFSDLTVRDTTGTGTGVFSPLLQNRRYILLTVRH